MDEKVENSLVEGGSLLKGSFGTRLARDDDGERQIGNGKTNRHDDDWRSEKSPKSIPRND